MTHDQFERVIEFLEKQLEANPDRQAFLDAYLKVIELHCQHQEKWDDNTIKDRASRDQVIIERLRREDDNDGRRS